MRIVVTGGSGDLGARVVRELAERGHDVVAASRRSGVDLSTGAGLEAVLEGVDSVVHAATDPRHARRVDVDGVRRIAEVLAHRPVPAHLLAISIVGCDRNPYSYYRAKRESEKVLECAGLPATVVRATQFHALAAFLTKVLRVGPLGFTFGDLAIQPVDVDWVASRLAGLAEGLAPDGFHRANDLAGPDLLTMPEIDALVAAHDGRSSRRSVRIRPMGKAMRAFGQRSNIPSGEVDIGGRTFAQWLEAQPRPLPRSVHDRHSSG